MTPFRIRLAARALAEGGVVAYPTEAVWGLGCDPDDDQAVEKILALKQRDISKGVILVAAHIGMLEPYLNRVSSAQRRRMLDTWPGPVTWLIPDTGVASHWISGGQKTLAVRVTAHPIAAALSRAFGKPIVSTSANPGGLPPARNLTRVKAYFGDNIDAYAPGKTGGANRPTEIRNLTTGEVIRSA